MGGFGQEGLWERGLCGHSRVDHAQTQCVWVMELNSSDFSVPVGTSALELV